MKISQNRNSKWVIDFTCKGKRIRRVIGRSKREAEDAAAAIRADILRDKYGFAKPKKDTLFEDFAKEYFELHSKQNKRSWKRDRTSIKNLNSFFKGKFLSNITPDLIEKYKKKRKEKVSNASINRELACLKNMFNKAIDWNKSSSNPVQKVRFLLEDNKKERILNQKEIESLLQAVEGSDSFVKEIIIIGLNTGMRKDEMLSMKWENVDFKGQYIHIQNSKSGKPRKVPMNDIVKETLNGIKRKHEFVFYNPRTKDYIKNVRKAFVTACEKAEIEGLRLHDLRHIAATKMIEAGIDLVTVSRILGHASIQMTMRYAHPTQESMRNAVNKLAEFCKKTRNKPVTLKNKIEEEKPVNPLFSCH